MTDLLVPVTLTALRLAKPERVTGPAVDYEVLPWAGEGRDHNPQTPYVASAITAEPFSDHESWLQPGVHLHWTLPPALTRGSTRPPHPWWVQVGELWFPPAPNRWLVRREARAGMEGPVHVDGRDAEKAWLVQSDFVHPPGADRPRDAAVYPLTDPDALARAGGGPPYRYVGRSVTLQGPDLAWPGADDATATTTLASLGLPLTALGPGDPAFAASYPACRNVFGFHDAEAADFHGTLVYRVWGWYGGDGVLDPLQAAWQAFRQAPAAVHHRLRAADAEAATAAGTEAAPPPEEAPGEPTEAEWAAEWLAELKRRFGWTTQRVVVASSPPQERALRDDEQPARLRCHGQLWLTPEPDAEPGAGPGSEQAPAPAPDFVALAETASDAVTTYLADRSGLTDETLLHALADLVSDADVTDHALDLAAALQDTAHAARFRPAPGPDRWALRQVTEREAQAIQGTGPDAPPAAEPPLAPSLAAGLDRLNTAQAAYDRLAAEVEGLRRRTFADWHQSMLTAYPEHDTDDFPLDPDAVADLLEQTSLAPLEKALSRLGDLSYTVAPDGGTELGATGGARSLAGQVVAPYLALRRDLAELHDTYALVRVPGSRFWRPQDPTVAIDHPAARLDDRARVDPEHPVDCYAVEEPAEGASFDYADWVGQPFRPYWRVQTPEFTPSNPLYLEWEVELRPDEAGNAGSGTYGERFILDTQRLPATGPDLVPSEILDAATGFQYLSGRTLVNGSAASLIAGRLGEVSKRAAHSPELTAALQAADLDGLLVLPLGGFNDALLMRRDQLQLHVDDPIGTPAQRALAARVRTALGTSHPLSPVPEAAYAPIRSGEIVLERLRVIDTFGRSTQWRPARLHTPPSMRGTADDVARLPVRFSQAGRLDLRWLSGAGDTTETSVHPDTSPVCGWLLPEELDGDLAVYDADGALLGTVEPEGAWSPAPGRTGGPASAADIASPHLRRVAGWLVEHSARAGFLESFLATLQEAGEAVAPSAAVGSTSRAVLLGQPLAVVRARLSVELLHPPVADVSPEALRARLLGEDVSDHGFRRVKVPVRLGGLDRHDDGLVGYWVETARRTGGPALGDFRAASEPPALELAVRDRPTVVTMLLDPHGSVHATSGVFPVKAVSVPPEHYSRALDQLRVTFPTGPVLTPPDQVAVPLPAEASFTWSWLERVGDSWVDVPHLPTLARAEVETAFGVHGPAVWAHLLATRRLQLEPDGEHGLLAAGPAADVPAPGAEVVPGVPAGTFERTLLGLARSNRPAELRASFDARVVAREGWLELRTTPAPTPTPTPTPTTPTPGTREAGAP